MLLGKQLGTHNLKVTELLTLDNWKQLGEVGGMWTDEAQAQMSLTIF